MPSKKKVLFIAMAFAALLGATEIVARAVLGLGTPPLYQADPEIEYVLRPNQDVMRFGNRYAVNQYSMRSEPFPALPAPGERRILVFGDSVINAGALVDQSQIATEALRRHLQSTSQEKVTIGNVSAFSWGPGNWLAYAKRYGFFGADTIILFVNNADYADVPTFASLNPDTHPSERPLSAAWEGAAKYGPRYLPFPKGHASAPALPPTPEQIRSAMDDLKQFLLMAKATGAKVRVIEHFQKSEVGSSVPPEGLRSMAALCHELGIPTVSLQSAERASQRAAYIDNIHLNAEGQRILLGGMVDALSTQAY